MSTKDLSKFHRPTYWQTFNDGKDAVLVGGSNANAKLVLVIGSSEPKGCTEHRALRAFGLS